MFLEGLDNMHARIIDPDYSILSSENTTTYSWQTIWPEFEVLYYLDDLDDDLIDDDLELQIAEKFKPILHKHSYDLQAGLQNFDNLLADGSFTLKVYNDNGQDFIQNRLLEDRTLYINGVYGIGIHMVLAANQMKFIT